MTPIVYFSAIRSPLGELTLASDGKALLGVHFEDEDETRRAYAGTWVRDDQVLASVRGELAEYFARKRTTFTLPLTFAGTAFQARVWRALTQIPYGKTASYGDIARRIRSPGASRAVGGANNRNPAAIVVPCHRVIGANGSLTGYGGGTWRKEWLLEFERGA